MRRADLVRHGASALLAAAIGASVGCVRPDIAEAPAAERTEPKEFAIDASVHAGYGPGGVLRAEIRIRPGGAAEVQFDYWAWTSGRDQGLRATQALRLDAPERETLHALLERSDFFGSWSRGERHSHFDTWRVAVTQGTQTASREFQRQEEFDEVQQFLWRVVHQAVADHAIAAGRGDVLVDLFEFERGGERVLRVRAIVEALRQSAVRGKSPSDRADAVRALRALLAPGEFGDVVAGALSAADDAARDAIVGALVHRGAIAAPLERADIVLPVALAELERSWRHWGRPPESRPMLLRDCASAFVVCGDPRAVPVLEKIVAELSTDETPVPVPALAAMGVAAIDSLERLLDDPRVGVRVAAARMCEGLACELASRSSCARPPCAEPSVALGPFSERLVPKLERAADDETADPRLRRAAAEALGAVTERKPPPGWKWHRLQWN